MTENIIPIWRVFDPPGRSSLIKNKSHRARVGAAIQAIFIETGLGGTRDRFQRGSCTGAKRLQHCKDRTCPQGSRPGAEQVTAVGTRGPLQSGQVLGACLSEDHACSTPPHSHQEGEKKKSSSRGIQSFPYYLQSLPPKRKGRVGGYWRIWGTNFLFKGHLYPPRFLRGGKVENL